MFRGLLFSRTQWKYAYPRRRV